MHPYSIIIKTDISADCSTYSCVSFNMICHNWIDFTKNKNITYFNLSRIYSLLWNLVNYIVNCCKYPESPNSKINGKILEKLSNH